MRDRDMHMLIHVNARAFKCEVPECGGLQGFNTPKGLADHMRQQHVRHLRRDVERIGLVLTVLPGALGKQLAEYLMKNPAVGTDGTRDTTAPSCPDPMSV